MSRIHTIQLECGMTLVTESLTNVSSVAMKWLLPVGSATDAEDEDGQATLLSELIFRGAGEMNSREHSDAFDRCGVERSCGVHSHHLNLSTILTAGRLDEALPLICQMVINPTLPDDALPPVRSLCLQSLDSLEDNPQHLVMLRLRQRHLPSPFNRSGYGLPGVIESATPEALRDAWSRKCRPQSSILGVAGRIDPDELARRLDRALAGWSGRVEEPVESASPERGTLTIRQPTSQVHIGLAFDAPHEASEDAMLERLAIGILSGSSSGRLFTEVRQKRSLCYSVGASYRSGRDFGMVTLYAGTTPERAQETLDVCLREIHRLSEGVSSDEFSRTVTSLKSNLIMQGESTPARAAAVAQDHFRLGRARSLEDIAHQIDEISHDQLNEYVHEREIDHFTLVSLGSVALEMPKQVASP